MTSLLSAQAIAPLLNMASGDEPAPVRVAALDAATRLPLDPGAWAAVAHAVFTRLRAEPAGSPSRQEAMRQAARVPLCSVRDALRRMADDPAEPDREVAVQALAEAGDPSSPAALSDVAVRGGGPFVHLEAMPVEQRLAAADAPTAPSHAPPDRRQRAIAARERLPQLLFEPNPDAADELQALAALPPEQVARLLVDVVAAGNRRVREIRGAHEGWPVVRWGDAIVVMVANLPAADDWPVAELVREQLGAAPTVLDDGQLAWVIARAAPSRVLGAVWPWTTGAGVPVAQRLRVLALVARVADEWSGRAGSPFRGDGRGAVAAAGRLEPVDDRAAPAVRSAARPARPRRAIRGGEPTPAAPPASAAPQSAAAEPDLEQRVVNTLILLDGRQRHAFVAGADHVVRCWIARPDATAAHADVPIPTVDIPPEGLPLTVQLAWRDGDGQDHTDTRLMVLPAERTLPSNPCDLKLHVPPGERFVAVDIVLRYRGRVFEAVRIEADVVAPGQPDAAREPLVRVQARRREVLELGDSRPVDATVDFEGEDLRVFGAQGGRSVRLTLARAAVEWLATTLHATEKVVARRRELHGGAAATLDADDPDVRRLLRDMARMGAGLYQQLRTPGAAFTDPGDRIELLDRGSEAYVPLEFVYDRGYPVDQAPLCRDGIAALDSDAEHCPRCGRAPPSEDQLAEASVVCPFGFWSMRKVIERIADGRHGQGSLPRAQRRRLPPVDSALLAAYDKVGAEEVAATRDELERAFGHLAVASDWLQWRHAVGAQPRLLVLLAHHGATGPEDYLQIGAETLSADLGRLGRGQIGRPYVNPLGHDPGPIVLLLGCQTAEDASAGYAPLARRVYEQRAAIVLGTLADVLGRDAAPLARELVRELASVDDDDTDFGTIMRRVRRRLLARGNLVALCLVALGDGEWRLSPRAAGVPT